MRFLGKTPRTAMLSRQKPWFLLFIGNQSWHRKLKERCFRQEELDFKLWRICSEENYVLMICKQEEWIIIKALDIQQGQKIWQIEIDRKEIETGLCYSYFKGGRLLLPGLNSLFTLERQGYYKVPMTSFPDFWYPDMSLDGSSFLIKVNNKLVLMDREGREKWSWSFDTATITFPYIMSDDSIIVVISCMCLYHFSPDGKILDQWNISPGVRLCIKGYLDNDLVLAETFSLVYVSGVLLLDIIHHNIVVLSPKEANVYSGQYGGLQTLPFIKSPSGKVAAITHKGLAARPRKPKPKCGKFPRLAAGTIGIYYHAEELIAADARGRKLWNQPISYPQEKVIWGTQHIATQDRDQLVIWSP